MESQFPSSHPFLACSADDRVGHEAHATIANMKNFLRVVKLTLSRRFTFAAAVVCSIGVALFWGGNLALIKPVIEIVFAEKKPHDLADHKVALAKEKLAETEKQLAEVAAELAAAPADRAARAESPAGSAGAAAS